MRKIIALAMALCLLLTVVSFPAFAGAEEIDWSTREKVTITWTTYYTAPPSEDAVIIKKIEDTFNVDIDMLPIDDANFNEVLNTYIMGNNVPDVIRLKDPGQFIGYVDQGMLGEIDMDTLRRLAPDICAAIDSYQDGSYWAYGSVDGKQYGIPAISSGNLFHLPVVYNQTWLEKLGAEIPTTLDEFHDLMVRFTKEDPDGDGVDNTYGLSSDGLRVLWGAYGVNPGACDGHTDHSYFQLIDGQVEYAAAKEEAERLEGELKLLLLPRDPSDSRSVVMELRGGVGGEEGALFAHSLLRMYTMYAQSKGWRLDTVNLNETELGGVKECSVLIEGEGAWSRLKFESGVHRVQRVPETESAGRVHTSAATVAVLPEAEEVELSIDPKDLQIDTYRASGAGGQHVNKTESAIRITHLPTGLVVECQDERSQYKNKDKAMKVLRSRLYEMERAKQDAAIAGARKSQVGSGDRSERIRTYNFPQGRVTDHRIGLTLYKIDAIMDGDLDELIDALVTADQAEKLKSGEA